MLIPLDKTKTNPKTKPKEILDMENSMSSPNLISKCKVKGAFIEVRVIMRT